MSAPEQSSVPGGRVGGVRQALREQTRAQHEALEQRVRLMDPDVSLDDYRAYLRAMLGYCEPVEASLAALPGWPAAMPDHAERNKAALIRRDLADLADVDGSEPSSASEASDAARVPRCPWIPPIHDVDQAFGAAYVLEGSTLGGQVLSRHLGERLGVTPERGAAFLASYGKDVGPMWRRFCDALERHAAGSERAEAQQVIVAAAAATFTAIDRWFQERLSQP